MGARVATVVPFMPAAQASRSDAFIMPGVGAADLARTVVFAAGQWSSGQATGEGSSTGASASPMTARFSLIDGNTLLTTREDSAGTAEFTVYVVEFPAP